MSSAVIKLVGDCPAGELLTLAAAVCAGAAGDIAKTRRPASQMCARRWPGSFSPPCCLPNMIPPVEMCIWDLAHFAPAWSERVLNTIELLDFNDRFSAMHKHSLEQHGKASRAPRARGLFRSHHTALRIQSKGAQRVGNCGQDHVHLYRHSYGRANRGRYECPADADVACSALHSMLVALFPVSPPENRQHLQLVSDILPAIYHGSQRDLSLRS